MICRFRFSFWRLFSVVVASVRGFSTWYPFSQVALSCPFSTTPGYIEDRFGIPRGVSLAPLAPDLWDLLCRQLGFLPPRWPKWLLLRSFRRPFCVWNWTPEYPFTLSGEVDWGLLFHWAFDWRDTGAFVIGAASSGRKLDSCVDVLFCPLSEVRQLCNGFIERQYRFGSPIKCFLVFLCFGYARSVTFVICRGVEWLRTVNTIETCVTTRSMLV